MGWAGAAAKLVLICLILRRMHALLDPDEQLATTATLVANGGAAYRWLKKGGEVPKVQRQEQGGVLPSALEELFEALFWAAQHA